MQFTLLKQSAVQNNEPRAHSGIRNSGKLAPWEKTCCTVYSMNNDDVANWLLGVYLNTAMQK